LKYQDEIQTLLDSEHSKSQRDKIVDFVGEDQKKMDALMSFFLDKKWHWRYNQRASWPIGVIGLKYPNLLTSYHQKMLIAMDNHTHDAVLRNIVRVYNDIDIPEEIEGPLFDKCFAFLTSPKFAIAIRCFAMTVLERIAMKYPGLQEELVGEIKEHMPHSSAGFKSRGSKIIARFEKECE